MKFEKPIFCVAVIVVAIAALASGIYWIFAHPSPEGWDEAYYAAQAFRDHEAVQSGDMMRIANTLVFGTPERPFFYRLAALPFTLLWGPGIEVLRISSLVCYTGAAVFVFLTGRRLAGTEAGVAGAMIFLLGPEVLASSVRFYTESGMYLALAAMLYFAARIVQGDGPSTRNWAGLGLVLGFGLLTKVSFAVAAAGGLIMLYVFMSRKMGLRKTSLFFAKAAAAALVVAMPWWIKNYAHALGHVEKASGFNPYQLAEFGPVLFGKYVFYFVQCNIGFLTAALCLVAGCVYAFCRKKEKPGPAYHGQMLWICTVCGLLLPAAQLLTVNHSMRLSSPAVVPLAVGLAIVFGACQGRAGLMLAAAVFMVQGGLIASSLRHRNEPERTLWETGMTTALSLREQWDWDEVYRLVDSADIAEPSIGLLGRAKPFNPGNAAYPWVVRNEKARVEMLPFEIDDETRFLEKMKTFDVIVTILDYPHNSIPRFAKCNAINRTLFSKIAESGDYSPPSYLKTGRDRETTLGVSIRSKGSKH